MTIRRVITIVAVVAAVAALVGSAVAYANAGDDGAGDTAGAADGATADTHGDHADGVEGVDGESAATEPGPSAGGRRGRRTDRADRVAGGHQHAALPPYDERLDAASDEDRAAADELREEVTATLERYADVDDAVADGYRAPRNPRSARHHYLNRDLARDGDVLDPSRPDGLVYHTVEGRDPVLLGAVFVAQPGVEAPRPAGDLVVWHSHDPACTAFFATADEPCTGSRRMLHVWTVDTVTLASRRDPQRTGEVHVTDPFGAPFLEAIERGPREPAPR